MNKAYFITATDTGAGKTFVTAGIAEALRKNGINVGVMKPVESGCTFKEGRLIPEDALKLKDASGTDDALDIINPYRFREPVAPNIAARLEGVEIDFEKIKNCFETLRAAHDIMLVEGAGGILAPVTDKKTIADLIAYLDIPLIIVASSKLGVINHTLLTFRHAIDIGLTVKGIILNEISDLKDHSVSFNRSEIERLTSKPLLSEVPFTKNETPNPNGLGVFDQLAKALI